MEFVPREFATPAVDPVSGRVVVGTRDGVLRSVTIDGKVRWAVPTPAPFFAGVLIRDGVVYSPGGDGVLRALKADTGAVLWTYDCGEELVTRAGARRGPSAGRLPVGHPLRAGRRRREVGVAVPAHPARGLHPPGRQHAGGARRGGVPRLLRRPRRGAGRQDRRRDVGPGPLHRHPVHRRGHHPRVRRCRPPHRRLVQGRPLRARPEDRRHRLAERRDRPGLRPGAGLGPLRRRRGPARRLPRRDRQAHLAHDAGRTAPDSSRRSPRGCSWSPPGGRCSSSTR